uniref:Beta-1,4-glucuronyltransferase 1 n=1 Tax=Glossina austeni TaxID=7395 RepID=A0A1A9V6I4_GLOAU
MEEIVVVISKYSTVKMSSIILLMINLLWSLRLYFLSQCEHQHHHPHHHHNHHEYQQQHQIQSTNNSLQSALKNHRIRISKQLASSLKKYIEEANYVDSSLLEFKNISLNTGRWDNQRIYKIIDFALIGEQYEQASAKSLVCLATQSSVERVYSLAEASKQWQGPISVAVFVAGSDEFSILQYYVTYLRLCFDFIRSNVTFHLAFPYERQPERESRETYKLLQMFDCQYPEKTLRSLLTLRSTETKRWRLRNVYPQNHMRNLARKGCQTKYVFLTDVDIIPSANIAPLLNEFLETVRCSSNLCAYVIPTFEIDERVRFPSSKTELMRLARKGLARPFHEKVFIYNQYATNFSSWLANTETDQQQIAISHKVTNYEFLYEPFYKNARPSWREQQNTMNRKRFETFKREILARYKKPPLFALEPKKIGRL